MQVSLHSSGGSFLSDSHITRKEVKAMPYQKPEMVLLGQAVNLILGGKLKLIENFFPGKPHSSLDSELDD